MTAAHPPGAQPTHTSMANILQRAAQLFSRRPATAATAATPPATGAQVRRFAAARVDRLAADWAATSQSINTELRSDLDRLRARGRDLANNNDYARKFIRMVQDNIVGPEGIRLQARVVDPSGTPDRLANQAIEQAWRQWQTQADLTGRQHLVDLLRTAVGGLPADGEFLLRIVRGAASGNAYGMAIQAIDVDRIDTTYSARHGNNLVHMGVEVDGNRRPVALHLFLAHPNDGQAGSRLRERVPMSELIHAFRPDRPDQLRGVPWMAPGMLSLHHLANFKLAALLAAEHGANHYGFFTTPDGAPPIGTEDATTGESIATSQPGTFDTLPAGVSFQAYDSKYPEQNFGPFVKTTLQRIASGWGVAYHSLANDLEGVSFSSIRSGTLEERDRWMADQAWLINTTLEPIYQAWLQAALLSGAITMPNGSALPAVKFDKFSRHEWQARRWDWVDPKADTEASILKVRAGLMAPQDLAASMGYDFDDVLANIKAAQDLAATYGIALPAYDSLPGAVGGGQPTAQDNAQPVAASKQLDDLQQQMRDLHTTVRMAALAADARGNQAPPTINVAAPIINLPEQRTEHHHHHQAPAAPVVHVNNEVRTPDQPAPVVHVQVEPTPIQVEAVIQPADVVVAGPTESVQTVERDADLEITRTITRHTYATGA